MFPCNHPSCACHSNTSNMTTNTYTFPVYTTTNGSWENIPISYTTDNSNTTSTITYSTNSSALTYTINCAGCGCARYGWTGPEEPKGDVN